MAMPADGQLIVTASGDKSIRIFNTETREQIHRFVDVHNGITVKVGYSSSYVDDIVSMAVSADGRFIVSGSRDKSIKVFSIASKQQLHHFQDAHSGTISINDILILVLRLDLDSSHISRWSVYRFRV